MNGSPHEVPFLSNLFCPMDLFVNHCINTALYFVTLV